MNNSKLAGFKYLRYKDRFQEEWSELDLSEEDKKILSKISLASDDNKNLKIFRPFHLPELSVLYAVECIYSNLSSDKHVGILTTSSSDFCGSKKDIKSEFERYGVTEGGYDRNVRSLSEMFSISRVDEEGFIVEDSEGDKDKSLVIIKDPSKIGKFEGLDALLVNYASKFPDEDTIQKIREKSRSPVIELFSPFSSWKKQNRMKAYGIKETMMSDCFPKSLEYPSDSSNDYNFPRKYTQRQSKILMQDKKIDYQVVESEISELFSKLDEARENATLGMMDEYLSRREFLLREIPVSLEFYQESLNKKDNVMINGNIRRTSEEFRSRIEGSDSGRIESAAYDIAEILDEIEEILMNKNPKYQLIKREIKSGNLDNANFFLSKKGFKDALEEKLNRDLNEKQLESVNVSHPGSIRSIREKEPMISFDDLPPWLTQFYLYPGSRKTGILRYSEPNTGMVQTQIEKKIQTLNQIHEENDPYEIPEMTIDGNRVESTSGNNKDSEQDILRGYWKEIVQNKSASGDRNSQLSYYALETDKGKKQIGPNDMILEKTSGSLAQSYEIISPSKVSEGSKVLIIDSETKNEVFEDRLNDFYESEVEKEKLDEIIESVEIWKRSIAQIVSENDEDYSKIWGEISSIERKRDTVLGWFKSAYHASSVLEMAEDVDLVIGPRNKKDLKKIGEDFQLNDVLANMDEIHAGMKTLRTINRSLGRNLQDNINSKQTLQKLIDSGEEVLVREKDKANTDN